MRWLLLKDLQILKRSPLQLTLLILYPIVIALLVGFAMTRDQDQTKVALYNAMPAGEPLGLGRKVDADPAHLRAPGPAAARASQLVQIGDRHVIVLGQDDEAEPQRQLVQPQHQPLHDGTHLLAARQVCHA